ncbi:MAG: PBP1A family penicillin-binding protein, partial [Bdellovibrionales bacterium]|nr:PBP1A family penicillin-binding protein [Bdellovibrionales bacterium]
MAFLFFLFYFSWIFLSLPRLLTMSDYHPPLLTEVYDRNNKKVGEFFTQRRLLFKYEDMPAHLIHAFVAAEDGSFFAHRGINYKAILRAAWANLKAGGKKVQGGSTITQQVARTLLLSSEKTYTRKLKEVILALRMETALSKQDILYIYLNQIYLGHGAYGVEMASRTYFRKSTKDLSLEEATLLAGLPKAPSRFSPVFNPERAKARQVYVLNRMLKEEYITEEVFKKALAQPVKVYMRKDFNSESPYFLETTRRILLKHFDQKHLLEGGLKVKIAMDFIKQTAARNTLRKGLEELDKRQGFRGVKDHLTTPEERKELLEKTAEKLKRELKTHLFLPPYSGISGQHEEELEEVKEFLLNQKKKEQDFFWKDQKEHMEGKVFTALLTDVQKTAMTALTPWGEETLKLEDIKWAVPIEKKSEQTFLEDLTEVFKNHDVISLRFARMESKNLKNEKKEKNLKLELYQEPLVEGGLISFDLENGDILALVGGYDYNRSQFNRAWQALRQSGSVFKPFVYGAAMERGFNPNSILSDVPVVFTPEEADEDAKKDPPEEELEDPEEQKIWKPSNISDRFTGDILFRSALIRSLNVPTVRVIEKTGLKWVRFYARILGLFSPLNPDFTMALGSSALTLYEITKAFSVFGKLGKRLTSRLILSVEDQTGDELLSNLSLDEMFQEKIEKNWQVIQEEKGKWFPENDSTERNQEWKKLLEENSNQLIPETNSYIVTNLLSGVIEDAEGTARRARVLRRPLAGKTGTTDGYYDTWFVGYSPFISTGVWVGFDSEKTLGRGETGSRVALPVWINYMEKVHEDLPVMGFPVPENIVFANI